MRFFLCGALVALLSPLATMQAQTAAAECSPGMSSYVGSGVEQKPNLPYHATIKTTYEQKLADGNSVQAFVRAEQARDAMGRTRSEMAQGCERGEDGQLHTRLTVNLADPVAKTHAFWEVNEDSSAKTVRVTHLDELQPRPKNVDALSLEKRRKLSALRQPARSEFQTEDLGEKTIAGVAAHGSRTVRTIPPGEEGNALPMVILNEEWRSKDLMILLSRSTDDPRRGRTTVEVEELTLGEPDASLFALPTGYKVEDIHPNGAVQGAP